MKIYTFGKKENPAVMLLPGTCCHWKSFEGVIPKLSENFYVLCVSYDGFDSRYDPAGGYLPLGMGLNF